VRFYGVNTGFLRGILSKLKKSGVFLFYGIKKAVVMKQQPLILSEIKNKIIYLNTTA
jgi:hypothetical protein